MKEKWVFPQTEVQQFMANEYVAACGVNTKGEYLFKCDAPKGYLVYYLRDGSEFRVGGGYEPCGETHTTANLEDFFDGHVDFSSHRTGDAGDLNVIVWAPGTGKKYHATTNLDYKIWTEPEVRS